MNGIADIKAALDYQREELRRELGKREAYLNHRNDNASCYSDSRIYELEEKVEHLRQMFEKAMETLYII